MEIANSVEAEENPFHGQGYSASITLPPLTTVRQPVIEMGQAAAEAVLRLLDDEEPMLPDFPTDLVIRKSAMRVRPGACVASAMEGTSDKKKLGP